MQQQWSQGTTNSDSTSSGTSSWRALSAVEEDELVASISTLLVRTKDDAERTEGVRVAAKSCWELLEAAPSREGKVGVAKLVGDGSDEACRELEEKITRFLRQFISSGGSLSASTSNSSPASGTATPTKKRAKLDFHDENAWLRSHSRKATFGKAVCRRDRCGCTIRGVVDVEKARLVYTSQEFSDWTEAGERENWIADAIQVAHIIPFSSGSNDEASSDFMAFWSTFLGSKLPYVGEDVTKVQDGLCLTYGMHKMQGAFQMAFCQRDNITYSMNDRSHTHDLVYDPSRPPFSIRSLPTEATFFSHDGSPLPDPQLLLLHRAVFNLINLRGRADIFDVFEDDTRGAGFGVETGGLGYVNAQLSTFQLTGRPISAF